MISCSAHGCNNTGNVESGITKHSFPKNKALRNNWIAALQLSKLNTTSDNFVCSIHFRSEDFDLLPSGIRLKDNAIPSIFPDLKENYKMEGLDIKDEPMELTSSYVNDVPAEEVIAWPTVSHLNSMLINDPLFKQIQIKKEIGNEDDKIFVKVGHQNENCLGLIKHKREDSNLFQKNLIPTISSVNDQNEEVGNMKIVNNEEGRKMTTECFKQEERTFICPFCLFPYKFKKTLNRHIREFHERLKRFSCTLCDYSCGRKNHLTQHISSVHQRIKPHLCPECHYAFSEKTHLNRHVLAIHQKIKPYKCSECNYAASQRGHLTKHSSVHNNHRLFKCPHCEYCCNEKSRLCRHVLSNHNILDNLIECPNCLFSCNTKQDLEQHVVLIHQNN